MVLVVSTRNLLQPVFFTNLSRLVENDRTGVGGINEGWRHTNTDRLIGLFHVFDYLVSFWGPRSTLQ